MREHFAILTCIPADSTDPPEFFNWISFGRFAVSTVESVLAVFAKSVLVVRPAASSVKLVVSEFGFCTSVKREASSNV